MNDRRSGLNRVAGLLAVAVLGTAQGARAREVSSRVALNTPEAVCRTAPSHSASVAATHPGHHYAAPAPEGVPRRGPVHRQESAVAK